jgi:hypothetical protein
MERRPLQRIHRIDTHTLGEALLDFGDVAVLRRFVEFRLARAPRVLRLGVACHQEGDDVRVPV